MLPPSDQRTTVLMEDRQMTKSELIERRRTNEQAADAYAKAGDLYNARLCAARATEIDAEIEPRSAMRLFDRAA